MNAPVEGNVKILRFDPEKDKESKYVDYKVPYENWNGLKIIDVLRYIYENQAPELAFREPCGHYVCGSCTIIMNKKPVLACSNLAEQVMVIEPLSTRKVIKDLVTEM